MQYLTQEEIDIIVNSMINKLLKLSPTLSYAWYGLDQRLRDQLEQEIRLSAKDAVQEIRARRAKPFELDGYKRAEAVMQIGE